MSRMKETFAAGNRISFAMEHFSNKYSYNPGQRANNKYSPSEVLKF